MVGVIGAVVVTLVTGPTVVWGPGETIAVTLLTIEISMSSRQGPELVVVYVGPFPPVRVVTALTVLGKTRLDMVGIGGRFIGRSMTGVAAGRCACKAIAVAIVAVQTTMRSCQPEELVMVRYRPFPRLGGMATLAICGESGASVIWVIGAFVVLPMTAVTFGGRALKTVTMTLGTIQSSMGTGESKDLVVIELGIVPRTRVVTGLALRRESSLDMVRITRTFVVLSVTAVAVSGCAHKTVLMTIRATQIAMTVVQGKEGVFEIDAAFDSCRLPGDRRVAKLTLDRKTGPLMIGTRRLAVVGDVAGNTLGGRGGKFEWRRTSVTTGAIDTGMRSGQWEERGTMPIPHLAAVVPGRRDMAGITTKTQLSTVSVRVAIGTSGCHAGEVEDLVAADAS